jgi:hypothetical protein
MKKTLIATAIAATAATIAATTLAAPASADPQWDYSGYCSQAHPYPPGSGEMCYRIVEVGSGDYCYLSRSYSYNWCGDVMRRGW